MNDTSLITFKSISNFTKDLGEIFGSQQHSLKLYTHLISKTTLAHDKAIKKHIDAFKDFCIQNREAITSKDSSKFVSNSKETKQIRIIYSKNVYIDIDAIFKTADKDTQTVIWKHLLVISALVDPAGKAKEILKQKTSGKEGDFLADIISKVEKNVDPDSNNPMEAVTNIMKSGVFTDIISGMNEGMQNGSLDLGKLMASVQGMVTTLNGQVEGEGQGESLNALNTMMSNLVGSMNQTSADGPSGEGAPPDLGAIMSMMGPMLSSLNAGNGSNINGSAGIPNIADIMSTLSTSGDKSIEEKIDEQVRVAKNKKIKKASRIEEIDE
jgi:hypothetical protein